MSKMEEMIDKIADTTEKVQERVAEKMHKDDDDAPTPGGAHRGEAAEEHKRGIMDKITDVTEKLVDKYDHSDEVTPVAQPDESAPVPTPIAPVVLPEALRNVDASGKV
jgi:hypothetical protein